MIVDDEYCWLISHRLTLITHLLFKLQVNLTLQSAMISLKTIPRINLSQSQVSPSQSPITSTQHNKNRILVKIAPSVTASRQNPSYEMRDKAICPIVPVRLEQAKTRANTEITSNSAVKGEDCFRKQHKQQKTNQLLQLQTQFNHFAGSRKQLLQQDYLRVCYEKMAMESYIHRQQQTKTAALHFYHN